MTIGENLTTFSGRPVRDWDAAAGLSDPQRLAYRIAVSYDDAEEGMTWTGKLAELVTDPQAGGLEALVIGAWEQVVTGETSQPIVQALADARDRLPALRHLFFGDITMEESEISWIAQSDMSPLLEAYPRLEHLTIRGGQSLSLGTPRHAALRELVIQSGGLPPSVVHSLAASELPALEHLELWLGEPNYGGDATIEDLAPLLKPDLFPRLRYLGLKNSPLQDAIAVLVAKSPVTAQLAVLDLSMGTLGDEGTLALLTSPAVKRLKKLDVHHHYISPDLVSALQGLGIEVDASDRQEPQKWGDEDDRYIEVAE